MKKSLILVFFTLNFSIECQRERLCEGPECASDNVPPWKACENLNEGDQCHIKMGEYSADGECKRRAGRIICIPD